MRALTLLAALVSIPVSGAAEWTKVIPNGAEFRLGFYLETNPILYFGFSHLNGNMQSISGGLGYISCRSGRVDVLQINLILETQIAESLASSQAAFLIVHRENWPGSSVVGSKTTQITSEVPVEFNAYAETPAELFAVREFGPLGISVQEKLFVSGGVDTSFVQTLADKDTFGLVYYEESEQRFLELFKIRLDLDVSQVRQFYTSCIGEN